MLTGFLTLSPFVYKLTTKNYLVSMTLFLCLSTYLLFMNVPFNKIESKHHGISRNLSLKHVPRSQVETIVPHSVILDPISYKIIEMITYFASISLVLIIFSSMASFFSACLKYCSSSSNSATFTKF